MYWCYRNISKIEYFYVMIIFFFFFFSSSMKQIYNSLNGILIIRRWKHTWTFLECRKYSEGGVLIGTEPDAYLFLSKYRRKTIWAKSLVSGGIRNSKTISTEVNNFALIISFQAKTFNNSRLFSAHFQSNTPTHPNDLSYAAHLFFH